MMFPAHSLAGCIFSGLNFRYAVLLGTAYFDGFVKFLLTNDRIHGLLVAVLQAERLEQADALLRQLARVNPAADAVLREALKEPELRPRLQLCCRALHFVTAEQLLRDDSIQEEDEEVENE
jgi:hypothetical protein